MNDDFQRLERQRQLHSDSGSKDFGRFVLHQRIGKGAMGIVFRATQKALDCTRAVKILNPEMIEDKELVARFEGEARSAARLAHENIVQVIDCGWHEGHAFIAMEYVEGNNLEEWLDPKKELGPPPLEIALLMLRDICRGLQHAHQNGIIHRDIKPANIMITPEGIIKIMDFGLARHTKETIRRTMHGEVLGTPAYMSPEQANGDIADKPSDIFSTGIVAYELLCGNRPFPGETYSTVRHSILTQDPEPLHQGNPLVPSEVEAIVHRMLQKDPARRYPSMDLVLTDLDAVIERMGLRRSRERIRQYVTDPETVSRDLRDRRLKMHLDQGLFYEKMGLVKIDDALLEFRRVLYLDPSNKTARDHLKKLEQERKLPAESTEDPYKTRPYGVLPGTSPVPRSSPEPDPVAPAPRGKAPPSYSPPRRPDPSAATKRLSKNVLLVTVGVVLTLVVTISVVGWILLGRNVGTLTIATDPPDANVVVDGGAPQKPGTRRLTEGTHTIRAAKDGYQSQERTVEIRKGAREMLALTLTPASVPAQPPKGAAASTTARLRIRTVPQGARVTLDGTRLQGPTNTTLQDLKPGSHQVRLEMSGFETVERKVVLQDGENELSQTMRASQPVEVGSLRLTLPPGSRVWIDGVQREQGNGRFRDLRANTVHQLRVERQGYQTITREVTLDPGEDRTIPLDWQVLANSFGVLQVKAKPYAELKVDGMKRGENLQNYELKLEAGKRYNVKITHPNFGTMEWPEVRIAPGETVRKEHDFMRTIGSIRIGSTNWAHVLLDGKQRPETAPNYLNYIPQGPHTVELRRPGYKTGGVKTVNVVGGDTVTVKFEVDPN
jgi:serine/threonine protein kinase